MTRYISFHFPLNTADWYNTDMESSAHWIKTSDRLPEKGSVVLVWHHGQETGFGLASIDEGGEWISSSGTEAQPSYWMSLPRPPGESASLRAEGVRGEVISGRLMLDIDEEPETVAWLMQHFIDGSAAVVNEAEYFVTDMKNEVIEGKMLSVFFLSPAFL